MEYYPSYRTAESVSPKHPDKLCDQISDAILDAYLTQDPDARVAVEVCGGHDKVFVTGEVTSRASGINLEEIVRRLAGDAVETMINLVMQSPEIARGVDAGGAGDQGIMIGYATNETPELLPREVVLARRLNQSIYQHFPFDGKTQVTLFRDPSGHEYLSAVVASFQNAEHSELEGLVREFIAKNQLPTLPEKDLQLHINPAGDWSQGGFTADTGLTGRKLIVDNYGPRIPIGGGAFSGKDPSKVDRSAAYMARKIAVDYLRKRAAKEVFVRLAYAIGYTKPLERTVIIDGSPEVITGYDLTPEGIINFLNLRRPIYEPTARYGHFGEGFDWDR